MDTQENFFSDSKKQIEEYIQDRILLLKLQMVEKVSRLMAALFTGLIIALFVFFILLFLSNMLAYYFAEITGSHYWGFGIVAAIYIILLIIVVAMRKKVIEKNIINTVINIFFDKSEEKNGNSNNQ